MYVSCLMKFVCIRAWLKLSVKIEKSYIVAIAKCQLNEGKKSDEQIHTSTLSKSRQDMIKLRTKCCAVIASSVSFLLP